MTAEEIEMFVAERLVDLGVYDVAFQETPRRYGFDVGERDRVYGKIRIRGEVRWFVLILSGDLETDCEGMADAIKALKAAH